MLVMEPRIDTLSEAAGEKAPVLVGEFECDDGVGRLFLGEVAVECGWRGGGNTGPGSAFGAIFEFDRRDWWCRFIIAR